MRIITLTLNPAVDVHIRLDELKTGCDNAARVERRDNGGKGVNLSRALWSYGADSICYTVLGKENGEDFCRELKEKGIDHRYIFVDGRIRENLNIHERVRDTVIATEGFTVNADVIRAVRADLSELMEKGDILCFTGRIPTGAPKGEIMNMLLAQREKGVRLVLDSKSLDKNDIMALRPYLIKPNEEEIAALTGRSADSIDEVIASAKELKEKGIENVLVTLGAKGGILATESGVYVAEVPKLPVRSTVGAGDSTVAGFLAGLTEELAPKEHLRLALAFGSAACMTEGSLPPDPCQIKALISRIKVTEK